MPNYKRKAKGTVQDASSTTTTTPDHPLPPDTPDWGIAMHTTITRSIEEVNERIIEFTETVRKAEQKANQAISLAERNEQSINALISKVNSLTDTVECLREENERQQMHILKNETYSRRENLLFRGFEPSDVPCDIIVRSIMTSMGVQGVNQIHFVRCHYLDNKQQIIVRFQSYADRERVWEKRFNLKNIENKRYYISEDFPSKIAAERKQLYPVFKAAKIRPEYHRKVTVINNRLKLNDEFFTVSTLDQVPNVINPAVLAERVSDEVYVFGGTTSRFCKHSNFYQRDFVYDHIEYCTAEQALQHKKARIANDLNKCREIKFNADPSTQKYLGQRVKGLNEEEWQKNKLTYMKEILLAKYSQHQDLRAALLDTANKKMAEANFRDSFYGIGMPLTHKDILKPEAWQGQNHLGRLLMEVRDELRI